MLRKRLLILGIRGIPASHGGFETFAERLAKYLVQRGWEVVVYCQRVAPATSKSRNRVSKRLWNGIELVEISVPKESAIDSIFFDFRATIHSLKEKDSFILVLGYNTAIFSLLYYLTNKNKRKMVFTNMDGLEWYRSKWNLLEKAWLYLNEKSATYFSNHLIADHPQIKKRYLDKGLPGDKLTVIPYCSEPVYDPDVRLLKDLDLEPDQYAIVIARPEPENLILEIIKAFSARTRGFKLVILGNYTPQSIKYHRKVLEAANHEVVFPGAIYDTKVVQALRYYARLYVHGHTVGGTNPSLVEALAASMPVLAHFNRFNFWVAGHKAQYFYDQDHLQSLFDELLDDKEQLNIMRQESARRFLASFSNDEDVKAHEMLFTQYVSKKSSDRVPQPLAR